MTLVTKHLALHGTVISEPVDESHFDTESGGGPVAREMRSNRYMVLTSGWVTINVPRGGSLVLEFRE